MATSSVSLMGNATLLQRAIRLISRDVCFINRWTSATSIQKAMITRYDFDTSVKVSKMTISRAMGKIDPGIDTHNCKHPYGIYWMQSYNEKYYFMQEPGLDPPIFPPTRNNKAVWDKINEIDALYLSKFVDRIEGSKSNQRSTKKRRLDEIDIANNISISLTKSRTLIESDSHLTSCKTLYWDSPEANKLFNPNMDETVTSCLAKRFETLGEASYDDDILLQLLHDVKDTTILSNNQKNTLRHQCLYLKKAYEIALQCMNTITWQDCATKAIEMLADVGINTVTSSRTIMKLNAYFRVNKMLDVPFVRVSREPKLFGCFPDIKSDLVKYCNEKISEGCMSTELVLSELTNIIIPKHFDIHIEEQKANNQIILDYDILLHALQLQKILQHCMEMVVTSRI